MRSHTRYTRPSQIMMGNPELQGSPAGMGNGWSMPSSSNSNGIPGALPRRIAMRPSIQANDGSYLRPWGGSKNPWCLLWWKTSGFSIKKSMWHTSWSGKNLWFFHVFPASFLQSKGLKHAEGRHSGWSCSWFITGLFFNRRTWAELSWKKTQPRMNPVCHFEWDIILVDGVIQYQVYMNMNVYLECTVTTFKCTDVWIYELVCRYRTYVIHDPCDLMLKKGWSIQKKKQRPSLNSDPRGSPHSQWGPGPLRASPFWIGRWGMMKDDEGRS